MSRAPGRGQCIQCQLKCQIKKAEVAHPTRWDRAFAAIDDLFSTSRLGHFLTV
jgi:hypothetical protein